MIGSLTQTSMKLATCCGCCDDADGSVEGLESGTRVGPEWDSSGTGVGLEWDPSGTRVGLEWD